jgi:hypothetical protein
MRGNPDGNKKCQGIKPWHFCPSDVSRNGADGARTATSRVTVERLLIEYGTIILAFTHFIE